MSTSDDRIISLQFDNAEFEKRLATTLQGLDKLDQTIQMAGAKQGLSTISDAASKVNLSSMAGSLDNISGKFNALGAIGFSAIQKLTQGVMGFVGNALNMAKTDVLGPIITGGKSRAESIEQAKFQFQGLGIDVNKGMASALAAVKGTAYGLDEAATVAAQFGASGIKAGDDMTRALTGISGIAAMTGRSYSEIGQIFTSAAGAGKVSNMDLQEFAIRGLNAAAAYAKQTGKTEAQVHQMATAGTLDFKSFADAMDKAFGTHATAANQTFTGSLSNLHAAMSRLGASFFTDRIDQMRDLFNALTPVIDNFTKAVQPVTNEILKLSAAGTEKLIAFLNKVDFSKFSAAISNSAAALANAANMVKSYFGVIGSAFHLIFPPNFSNDLAGITFFFERLFKALTPGPATLMKLEEIFTGLFSALSIAFDVFKGLIFVVESFFGAFKTSGASLNFIVAITNALTRFNAEFVKTGKIDDFFDRIAKGAAKVSEFLQNIVGHVKNLVEGLLGLSSASGAIDKIRGQFEGLSNAGGKVHGVLDAIGQTIANVWQAIAHFFSNLVQKIATGFNPDIFKPALSAVNTGLLVGIGLLLKGFLDKGFKFDLGGGMFGQMTTGLHSVNQTLKLMQTDLKAKTLMEIAAAIAILAASVTVLSMIRPDALQSAMTALAFGFTQLVVVMKLLDSMGKGAGGGAKLALLGASMTEMAGSAVILAGAVKILSGIGVEGLQKGLTAIAVALGELVGAAKLMSGSSTGLVAAGLAMNAMATGLVVIAGVVRLFSGMSWGEITKGLVGIAGSLLIIATAMKMMPVVSTLAAGAAMIPMAIGLTILAGAIRIFGSMPFGELVKGLVGLAGGLIIIAVAMHAMPLTLPVTAAGLLLVALALNLMVPAIELLGHMDIGNLAKGLGGLAVLLGILAVATNAMTGALGGAAALVVVSGALLILTAVLHGLGDLSWGELIKGLVGIAAVLVVLGLSAGVLEPLIPALLGLGAALALVGAGFALFGAGAFLVATAFSIMAVAGAAGAAGLVSALVIIIKAIPQFVASLVTSLIQAGGELLKGADQFLTIVGEMLGKVADLIVTLAPKIAAALVAIITSALELIRQKFPDVMQTAFDLLMTFLTSLDTNMPLVVAKAVDVVVNFVNALAANAGKLVTAGANLITSFLGAIAGKIADIVTAGVGIVISLLNGIANNISKVVAAGANLIDTILLSIAGAYLKIVNTGASILVAILQGLANNITTVATAATNVAIAFVNGIADNSVRFANAAGDALVHFLNGMADAINNHVDDLRNAGIHIIGAIINGMTGGLAGKAEGVVKGLVGIAGKGLGAVTSFLGISSPSKKFMEIGENIALGLSAGIDGDTTAVNSAVTQAEKIVKAFSDSLTSIPDSLAGMNEFNPVITPILDLTQVKATASGLGSLIPTPSITPNLSYNQANQIASTVDAAKSFQTPAVEPKDITFNQTINAPEPLSTNDVYKNTKSQLAMAKEELRIA